MKFLIVNWEKNPEVPAAIIKTGSTGKCRGILLSLKPDIPIEKLNFLVNLLNEVSEYLIVRRG